uniref:Indoleamine 2,3-dioxygenase n=1 Tax=viral metagenome TaxID=1070528 RepID=A0A6C0C9H6_9ZZZZ
MNIYELFDLSPTHGFLSKNPTPKSIRPPYDIYMRIANQLPELVRTREIQKVIGDLPLIKILEDTSIEEYRTLYSMLTVIQAGYIWYLGEGNHHRQIPKQLAVPLHHVSKYLGLPPLATHAALDLYNWQLIDPNGKFELENLTNAFTITGDKSESHFYLVMVAIEYIGSDILNAIILLISGQTNITDALQKISKSITRIIDIMNKLRAGCDPKFFYDVLRIFLTGWTNEILFPNGMDLEDVESHVRWSGGSAAQSSIIQVLDIFFGIKHAHPFLNKMREYMPTKHRQFLTWLESSPECPSLIHDNETTNLYNECITKLSLLRSIHMGFIHTYIFNQSSDSRSAIANEGTGGTPLGNQNPGNELIKMLKDFRIETDDAKII